MPLNKYLQQKKYKLLIKLIRPELWIKNSFIFFPLFFNGQILNLDLFLQCLFSFFSFSFIASSIYCFNDIYDLEADKNHPKKCIRPIASGNITIKAAYIMMIICIIISMLLLLTLNINNKINVLFLLLFYFVLNILYCIKLKQFAIVDVVIISIGFVLRVILGGITTEIWLSEWIIMMTFLMALFLAFAKRRDDVILYQHKGELPRKNTNRYNIEFMNQVMTILSTVTIITYIMYTLSPAVINRFNSRNIYLTTVFVLIGIIRYLQLTIVDLKSENPTTILLKDKFIQICIIGWITSFLVIIYL
jgi:4-hydroxybenzoate polyprenyltransferase